MTPMNTAGATTDADTDPEHLRIVSEGDLNRIWLAGVAIGAVGTIAVIVFWRTIVRRN